MTEPPLDVLVARSAGPVLRALRKLGGGGAFALCARGFGDRFQGSLWTDPAPLGVLVARSAGSVLRSQEGLGQVRRSECPDGAPYTSPG